MDPTEEEVALAVDDVWAQVAALAATAVGMAMMATALDEYPRHEE